MFSYIGLVKKSSVPNNPALPYSERSLVLEVHIDTQCLQITDQPLTIIYMAW